MPKWMLVGLFFVFLFSLGLAGVYFWDKLGRTQEKATRQVIEAPVVQQMQATREELVTVAKHIGGIDDKYGGKFFQGVLEEVVVVDNGLIDASGKELAIVTAAFEVAYLRPDGVLGRIKLAKGLKLSDGSQYELDVIPIKSDDLSRISSFYEGKKGTQLAANFLTDKQAVISALEQVGKPAELINQARQVFEIVKAYEISWQKELDSFEKDGDPGRMEYLMPLFYTSQSFQTEYGVFETKAKS